MPKRIIAIASDHAGYGLKQELIAELHSLGYEALNLGTDSADSVDYPDYADAIARALKDGKAERGIAICGSGIGISIAANRHRHIRAALVSSAEAAGLAREHNNANILALGARLIDTATAKQCLTAFLTTEFAGGRHQQRLEKLV